MIDRADIGVLLLMQACSIEVERRVLTVGEQDLTLALVAPHIQVERSEVVKEFVCERANRILPKRSP